MGGMGKTSESVGQSSVLPLRVLDFRHVASKLLNQSVSKETGVEKRGQIPYFLTPYNFVGGMNDMSE